MHKKIISLFIVLFLGLFVISGCEKEVGQQVNSQSGNLQIVDDYSTSVCRCSNDLQRNCGAAIPGGALSCYDDYCSSGGTCRIITTSYPKNS